VVEDPRMFLGERRVDQVRVRFDEGEREGTTGVVPRSAVDPSLE
jgi:hypothetical protein